MESAIRCRPRLWWIIALALADARGKGLDDVDQTGHAVRAVLAARPDMTPSEALWHVNALGPDHPDLATSLNNLAGLYQAQGKYGEAEPLYKRSLAVLEKALGPDHSHVATSLDNLAALYQAHGRYGAAEPLYKRSLVIVEKALGPEHPTVAQALENYAALLRETGHPRDAAIMAARAKVIRAKHAQANPVF